MSSDNIVFTLYKLATGEMDATITCQQETAGINTPAGFGRVDGAWDSQKYYVANGVVTAKTSMSPVVTGSTISNLPIPCTVEVEWVVYQVDDGVFEFSSPLPGPYKWIISAVPYLTTDVTLP